MRVLALIKKDLTPYIVNSGIMIPVLLVAIYLSGENNGFVLVPGMVTFLSCIFPILLSEQYEEKNHGYNFLSILPLKIRTVVISKSTMLFFNTCFFTFLSSIAAGFVGLEPDSLTLTRGFDLLGGNLGLLFGAALYIGTFRYGFTRFVRIFLTLILGLNILLLFFTSISSISRPLWDGIMRVARSSNWFLITGASLAVFAGLMALAAVVKESHRID